MDGHNRQKKSIKYDLSSIPCIIKKFESDLEEFAFVLKINLLRRNMNEAQRIFNSQELFKTETKLAKLRQKKGTLASDEAKGKTAHKIAKIIGTSPSNYEKGQAIINSKDETLIESWIAGDKKTGTAYLETKRKQNKIIIPPLPNDQFNVMELDPNWGYNNQSIGFVGNGGSANQFPTVKPQEFLDKWVPKYKKLLAKDSVVFLWVTVPLMNEIIQLKILEGLGCKYKTTVSWHKIIPKDIFGGTAMGYWFKGEMEHCLVGIKGKIEPFRSELPNFKELPITKHSEKPIEFKEMFEEATKNIPNRKMFEGYARRKRTGWFTHGAELE